MAETTPFVDGWDFVQTLGEGAYGEVKLAVNRVTEEAVAVKILDGDKVNGASENIRKELCIHKMMNNSHIIRFYGHRKDGTLNYLFLEYASGGELFDRIEPDQGMAQSQAQRYFRQLITGVEYLHTKGVAHRDIKPENLLLDDSDNLKISDFGLSTVFRHQGKERKMNKCCGTPPYVAPEVMRKEEYRAEPADIWSCGIVLVAMMAGALLKKILEDKPGKRWTIAQIKKDRWYCKTFSKSKGRLLSASPTTSPAGPFSKRICSGIDLSPPMARYDSSERYSSSQPELRPENTSSSELSQSSMEELVCAVSFSQPAAPDDMFLASQTQASQSSQTPLQRLVKRMTRFVTKVETEKALAELKVVVDKLGLSWKKVHPNQISVSTTDKRGSQLIFKVFLYDMNGYRLVDFRLSKGDGLEFKRLFVRIKRKMTAVISKAPALLPINMPDTAL
ncbi:CHEK1 [Branchiostoma lanceolatum]|uniref:non-specific serine/threonine protein kinase n=1 Tax=Branchiostoma lanceolatum TaxID=7740 RepID=A0A8J9ZX51_BRALA|nr:CHEK1 [Branchiostoma lanceolatum]